MLEIQIHPSWSDYITELDKLSRTTTYLSYNQIPLPTPEGLILRLILKVLSCFLFDGLRRAYFFTYFTYRNVYFFYVDTECATLTEGDQSFSEDIGDVPMKWYETPSIIELAPGKPSTYWSAFIRFVKHIEK